MNVKVKLVGRYKEISGCNEIEFPIHKGDTIWHVIDMFVKQFPKIQRDKKFIMVSKNDTYTTRDTTIEDGDKITITPPVVSGG
jgi:molybdopterin converting factor small subunit